MFENYFLKFHKTAILVFLIDSIGLINASMVSIIIELFDEYASAKKLYKDTIIVPIEYFKQKTKLKLKDIEYILSELNDLNIIELKESYLKDCYMIKIDIDAISELSNDWHKQELDEDDIERIFDPDDKLAYYSESGKNLISFFSESWHYNYSLRVFMAYIEEFIKAVELYGQGQLIEDKDFEKINEYFKNFSNNLSCPVALYKAVVELYKNKYAQMLQWMSVPESLLE